MKLYLVKAGIHQRYAGSMADVSLKKAEMSAKYQVNKKQITVEDVEIKTSKPDLLLILNSLCEKVVNDEG